MARAVLAPPHGASIHFADTSASGLDRLQSDVAPICCLCNSTQRTSAQIKWRCNLSEDNRPGSSPGVKLQRTRNVLESVYQMSAVENPRDPVSDTGKQPEQRQPGGTASTVLQLDSGTKCGWCDTEGSVECLTCSGSGLYVEPCLESHGVIVKVTCLGCGGSGRVLCPYCGGRRQH